jgi:membrane protein
MWLPMQRIKESALIILKRFSVFWYWVVREFFRQKCTARASSLSLTSLLAVVPMIVVLVTVLSMIPSFTKLEGKVQDFIFHNFVPSTGNSIGGYIEQITSSRVGLPVMAVVFLFVVSVMMMMSLESALNDIWKTNQKRSIGAAFLLYWGCLTLGPVLLGTGLIVSSYIASLHWVSDISLNGPARLLSALPFIFNLCAFTFVYKVIPYAKVNLFHAFLGALFATVVFELAKMIFTLYVTNVPTYEIVYGALAVIPLFIIWVFVSWQIFLLGAIVVNGLYLSQAKRDTYKVNDFMLAIKVIHHLTEAQKTGNVYTLKHLMKCEKYVSVNAFKKVLNRLSEVKLVFGTFTDEYILNFDPNSLTMLELYNTLEFYFPIGTINIHEGYTEAFKQLDLTVAEALNKPVIKFV